MRDRIRGRRIARDEGGCLVVMERETLSMSADNDLRLAWLAERAGRLGTRDVLLTLAVASSGPDDHWAQRAWARIVISRPDHFFSNYASLSEALDDPQVVKALSRLRRSFPPLRVERMLGKSAVLAGKYTGQVIPLKVVLQDLIASDSLLQPKIAKRRKKVKKAPQFIQPTQSHSRDKSARKKASTHKPVEAPPGAAARPMAVAKATTSADLSLSVLLTVAVIVVTALSEKSRKDSRAA